jgi:hypothetical protein
VKVIKKRASDIDILSVQLYGELVELPTLIKEVGWEGPIIVSEWGAIGYWEVEQTAWGAPIEENSTVKADGLLKRHQSSIKPLTQQCIGSYVFLWGQKQERTSTWFGFFTEDGRKTEVVDVMHRIWTGEWPVQRCPRIVSHMLNKKHAHDSIKLKAGKTYEAIVQVSSVGDFTYRWEVLRESESTQSGGDAEEVPEKASGAIVHNFGATAEVLAPKEKGAYRLYIYIDDNANHTAHSNIPFLVG